MRPKIYAFFRETFCWLETLHPTRSSNNKKEMDYFCWRPLNVLERGTIKIINFLNR